MLFLSPSMLPSLVSLEALVGINFSNDFGVTMISLRYRACSLLTKIVQVTPPKLLYEYVNRIARLTCPHD